MSTATELPESFAAGTTVKYTRSLADYPASDGWTLTLTLAGAAVLTVTAAASGADHAVTLTSAQTAGLAAGEYRWAESVTKDGDVYRAASGLVMVEPHLEAAGAGDLQSTNEKLLASTEKILAAIDAVIAVRLGADPGTLPKDIESYSIDGVAVTRVSLQALEEAREQREKLRVRLSYAIARARRGGGFGRQHRATLTRN